MAFKAGLKTLERGCLKMIWNVLFDYPEILFYIYKILENIFTLISKIG